jgi:hypothetical protein
MVSATDRTGTRLRIALVVLIPAAVAFAYPHFSVLKVTLVGPGMVHRALCGSWKPNLAQVVEEVRCFCSAWVYLGGFWAWFCVSLTKFCCFLCVLFPVMPVCHEYTADGCSGCAGRDECAWCASQQKCMTVSEIFASNCRGQVFDLPCPESFVGGRFVLKQQSC